MAKPIAVIVHHEAGNNGFVFVNQFHKDKWNFKSSLGFYAGYQYYWDKNTGWHQARAEDETGAHTLDGWNTKSVGICMMGNYEREELTDEAKAQLRTKIDEVRARWGIPRHMVFGHFEKQPSKPTACPASIMEFVREYRQGNILEELQRQVDELKQRLMELIKKLNALKK